MMDQALAHLRRVDPIMARLIDSYPAPTFKAHGNHYHELVDSIISQQLSVTAARSFSELLLFGSAPATPAVANTTSSDTTPT